MHSGCQPLQMHDWQMSSPLPFPSVGRVTRVSNFQAATDACPFGVISQPGVMAFPLCREKCITSALTCRSWAQWAVHGVR